VKSLIPFQQQLLERLEREPRSRAILLRAIPGTGLTEVVVRLVASAARRGESVVVVTDHRILVDEWTYRLAEAQAGSINSLTTSSDVLMELDRIQPIRGISGVLVASVQLLSQGAGRELADLLHPSLLIVDRMERLDSGFRRELIEPLASRSERVILLTHKPAAPEWFEPGETISVNLAEVLESLPAVEALYYRPSDHEDVVSGRALSLLSQAIGDFALSARTRAALHASVLRLIANLSGEFPDEVGNELKQAQKSQGEENVQSELLQEAWAIVDSLEELDSDGRLEAAHTLVQRAAADHRLCIVTTELAAEADYVAGYLRSNAVPALQLSAASSHPDRQQVVATLVEGSVLVITNPIFGLLPDLPLRTQVVWWSPPRNSVQAQEWLALTTRAPHSTVIAIVSQPPLPGDREFQIALTHGTQRSRPDSPMIDE
jgi:hypothetical protein